MSSAERSDRRAAWLNRISPRVDASAASARYGQINEMSTAIGRLREAIRPHGDALIALALVGQAILDLAINPSNYRGPDWANVVFILAVAAVTLWRRRAPLPTLLAIVVLGIAWAEAFYAPDVQAPVELWLAALIALYSLAAHAPGPKALAGAALAIGSWVAVIDVPGLLAGRSFGQIASAWPVYPIAWLVGWAVRRKRLETAALEDRARRLEREREELARIAVAEERARIARELHDVIAHEVSVIVLQAVGALGVLEQRPELARDPLLKIEKTSRDALAEMRRLLGILREDKPEGALAPHPGIADLEALAERVGSAGVPVDLHVDGEEPDGLPAGIELSVYRIVQEALTNVVKHAGPARAKVFICYETDAVSVEIVDDGRAPAVHGDGRGHGLLGMRERVTLYGGHFEAGPRGGGGFAVRARLPLQ